MGIIDNLNNLFNMSGSKRRSRLGVGVAKWDGCLSWYYRNPIARLAESLGKPVPDKFVTDCGDEFGKLSWKERFQLQRNGKKALAMRALKDLPEHVRQKIDQRRDWNKANRPVLNVLEQFFPSFQFSYSTPLPDAYRKGSVNIVVSGEGSDKRARISDIARSHSIWLDPVDAPKELYKYRLRINRVINWVYKNNCVPVMMTLTTYHRWHYLDGLKDVLRESWKDLFSSYSGRRRVANVDLQGWVRRLEITINDNSKLDYSTGELKSDSDECFNSGWHPHYHAILIVPKDKLQRLSDLEQDWRDAWVDAVCKHFERIFGEKIDESFLPAFRQHGLVFSRYGDGLFKGQLRHVDTGDYLAKIMGYDNAKVFGGDSEMTDSGLKDSKIPFDLLRDSSLPASNVDLWVEYAFATKGIPAIRFSKDLEDRVNSYFREHPEHIESSSKPCPAEAVVASLDNFVHQLLYRNFKIKELQRKAAEGYEALTAWLKQTYVELGLPELCNMPFALPRPPS